MLKIIFILILANKKVSQKKQIFLSFFFILKLTNTILNILKIDLLIF